MSQQAETSLGRWPHRNWETANGCQEIPRDAKRAKLQGRVHLHCRRRRDRLRLQMRVRINGAVVAIPRGCSCHPIWCGWRWGELETGEARLAEFECLGAAPKHLASRLPQIGFSCTTLRKCAEGRTKLLASLVIQRACFAAQPSVTGDLPTTSLRPPIGCFTSPISPYPVLLLCLTWLVTGSKEA